MKATNAIHSGEYSYYPQKGLKNDTHKHKHKHVHPNTSTHTNIHIHTKYSHRIYPAAK